jgi:hypothetical protein
VHAHLPQEFEGSYGQDHQVIISPFQ